MVETIERCLLCRGLLRRTLALNERVAEEAAVSAGALVSIVPLVFVSTSTGLLTTAVSKSGVLVKLSRHRVPRGLATTRIASSMDDF